MTTAQTQPNSKGLYITKAVTHIPLRDMNAAKLEALNAVAEAYMQLCQVYVTHFCTVALPHGYAEYVYDTPLSDRWHRVAVQQAASIASGWRSNRRKACAEYLRYKTYYDAQDQDTQAKLKPPQWTEWNIPSLHSMCIQANVNVVAQRNQPPDAAMKVEPVHHADHFDLWLQIATLQRWKPIYVPIKLSHWHREMLKGQTVNTSTTLHRRTDNSWWLTLSIDEWVEWQPTSSRVAADVGMANYLTSSSGQRYGSFSGDLSQRHEADRAKRQRKAKLRACLNKKGVINLPSTSSTSSQRLGRHIRQEINRAVNQFFADNTQAEVVLEALTVASMRFKAKRMNARLYASQLGYLYDQIQWGAAKRGVKVRLVNPAYSSQECPHCHFVSRANRPNQQTFCCQVCRHRTHADENACANLLSRVEDEALAVCKTLDQIKALLLSRHECWKAQHGYP
jgi:IS605 OrfB family transposase